VNTDLRQTLQSLLGSDVVIERELGGGGMARVFVAHEKGLDRKIVIKVLPPELAGAVSVDRFKREIQLAAKLQHPHIVPVMSAVSAGDILYYTMPFVDGESLGARIARNGAIAPAQAIPILRDAIRALAYAHRHGVVHRDIKPDNILLSEDSALVADFGIAKALSEATGTHRALTTVGISVGTPAYMAPEQSVGDAVDQRADIYSIGAVAYEMLTGEHLFAGKSAQQLMAAHVMETPAPLSTKACSVPAPLASLVMRCLEKDPAKRPQSADDLLRELDAAVTPIGGTISVPSASRAKRWKIAATLSTLAVLLVVGGALAFAPRDKLETMKALMRRKPAQLHTNRIIVAPFENETGNPRFASLGSMAADWIAQGLTRAGGFEVVDARTTQVTGDVVDKIPWPFKPRDRGTALAEETGAGILVSGRIYQDGDSLRVSTKMTDVSNSKLLLALTPISGLAATPTKVLEALTKRTVANVVWARDRDRVITMGDYSEVPSLEAYEELSKGVEGYFRGDTAGYAHLAKSIAMDSTYPTPVVFLAFSRLYRGDFAIAKPLLARAAQLRERMAPADKAMLDHLQAFMRADGAGGLTAAEQFMAATPGSQESPLLVASVALSTGYPRKAITVLQQIDPDRGLNLAGSFYWSYEAAASIDLGQYSRALDFTRAGMKRFPASMAGIHAEVLAALGKFDELGDFVERAPAFRGSVLAGQTRVAGRAVTALRIYHHDAAARRLAGKWLPQILASRDTTPELGNTVIVLSAALDQWNAMMSVADSLLATAPNSETRRWLISTQGVIAAHLGDRARAQRAEDELTSLGEFDFGKTAYLHARVAASLGERDRVVSLLAKAAADGINLQNTMNIFRNDWALLGLRDYPPFQQLIKPKD